MARGLVSVNERSEDGGPFLETVNEERVAHVQPSVGIVLGESPAEQPGTLYVTTRCMLHTTLSLSLSLALRCICFLCTNFWFGGFFVTFVLHL